VRGLEMPSRQLEDGVSLSGRERNRVFFNRAGSGFVDLSRLSGLDDPADGRTLAWLDFDRDGWTDVAVANANRPLLQLFRNEIGDLPGAGERGRSIALRLVGGNQAALPSAEWSNRDGIGARIEVELGKHRLLRERRAGEGFGAQNSAVLLIGIGARERADAVTITWPSGLVRRVEDVPAGALLTVYEDPRRAPDRQTWLREPLLRGSAIATRTRPPSESILPDRGASDPPPRLRVLTTMATWCETCRGELPHFAKLRESFDEAEVQLLGIPVDSGDSRPMLEAWRQRYRPAYELQLELDDDEIAQVKRWVLSELRRDALPASIVTDRSGRVLETRWGAPTLSDLRRLLGASDAPPQS